MCIPQMSFYLLIGLCIDISSEVDLQIEFQASKEKWIPMGLDFCTMSFF